MNFLKPKPKQEKPKQEKPKQEKPNLIIYYSQTI